MKKLATLMLLLSAAAVMVAQNQDIRRGGGGGGSGTLTGITNADASATSLISSSNAPVPSLKGLKAGDTNIVISTTSTNVTISYGGTVLPYYKKTVQFLTDVANSAAVIPIDGTNPQIGEGALYKTVTYTPQAPNHVVVCKFTGYASSTSANLQTEALFVNATADAIGATITQLNQTQIPAPFTVAGHYLTPDTSQISFSLRFGQDTGLFDDTFINRVLTGSQFGGNEFVLVEIEEFEP